MLKTFVRNRRERWNELISARLVEGAPTVLSDWARKMKQSACFVCGRV